MAEFADFYFIGTGGLSEQAAPGEDIGFPQDGPSSGGIARASESSFTLAEPGTYYVQFVLNASQCAQVLLTLNGAELDDTATGGDTAQAQVVGASLVTTDTENAVLTVRNPSENSQTFIIAPTADGNQAVASHLVILRLQ